MKNFLSGLLFFSFFLSYAQEVNDFKYIIVPDKFSDFDKNQYRLNYFLLRLLEEKKYEVLLSDQSKWPEAVVQNPCLALNSDVKKGKVFLKIKLDLVFTDCQGREIGKLEGISNEKEYQKGYQEAIRNATQKLKNSFPKELDYKTLVATNKVQTGTNPIEIQGNISEKSWLEKGIEFTNGAQTLILTGMKDGTYILIRKNNQEIIAQLKPSSREGIYHTTVLSPDGNYTTIGFYDEKTIGIEFKNNSNEFILSEFKKSN